MTLNLFSGLFNVARNPVTKRHDRLLTPPTRPRQRHLARQRDRSAPSPHCLADFTTASHAVDNPLVTRCCVWVAAMTLVPINVVDDTLAGLTRLMPALQALPPQARVTVMIHGYQYAPGQPGRCPYDHIFSYAPAPGNARVVSWPRRLDLGKNHLGIGFGWDGGGSLWRAWAMAAHAGGQLALLVDLIAASGHRVDLVGHSLGARVALCALAQVQAGSVGKAIFIAPAAFQQQARIALAGAGGAKLQVLNVISRENALFDRGLEWLLAAHRWRERSLGAGLDQHHSRWIDLRIDLDAARAALAHLGYPVAAPTRRVCHWSGYLRQGLFPLYRAVLSDRLALPKLGRALQASNRPAPRPEPFADLGLFPFGAPQSR
jgi:pimeloyl-ACP methyl ester carboxylesterase